MERITFIAEDSGTPEFFYVLDRAALAGKDYLLVTDAEEGDGIALVLRDDSDEKEKESLYTIVEEDLELQSVLTLFRDTLEDLGIDLEADDE